jgi:signal transduction histidine kinase
VNLFNTWIHRWIYYLSAGLMLAACALRSVLVYQNSSLLGLVLILLIAWLLLFIGGTLLSRRLPRYSIVFISLGSILVLTLLLITHSDFFAFLFTILAMQAMQHYPPRLVGILIGISTILTFLALVQPSGAFQAMALAVVFGAVSVFMGVYIWSTRRARAVEEEQRVLLEELQEANRKLETYSQQKQQLAVGRERQRLARELHDSVTQTIFSMTLTTQSALLLLERDRQQVASQLDRLQKLAQSTLAEMQVLISRLAPESLAGVGFIPAIQQDLEERRQLENLAVVLEVEGDQPFSPTEEAGLFRIAQEALNNIVKHAHVSEAVLRLHLANPFWMEIEDHGTGFVSEQSHAPGRLGLNSMCERATEMGWNLKVDTSPGKGTRIRVEKTRGE